MKTLTISVLEQADWVRVAYIVADMPIRSITFENAKDVTAFNEKWRDFQRLWEKATDPTSFANEYWAKHTALLRTLFPQVPIVSIREADVKFAKEALACLGN